MDPEQFLDVVSLPSPLEANSSTIDNPSQTTAAAAASSVAIPRPSLGSRMDVDDSSPETPAVAGGKRKRAEDTAASDVGDCTDATSIPPKRTRVAQADTQRARNINTDQKTTESPIKNFLRVLAVIEDTVRDAIVFAYDEGLKQGLQVARGASARSPPVCPH